MKKTQTRPKVARNKIFLDDPHVSWRRNQENKGLWLIISTDYSENWRQFLTLGGIKKEDGASESCSIKQQLWLL